MYKEGALIPQGEEHFVGAYPGRLRSTEKKSGVSQGYTQGDSGVIIVPYLSPGRKVVNFMPISDDDDDEFVCMLVSCTKTAEPIEMPFHVWTVDSDRPKEGALIFQGRRHFCGGIIRPIEKY